MDGFITQDLAGLGGEPTCLWGSFAPNGATNPVVTANGGPPGMKAFTTVYAATGQFTVTLPAGITIPTANSQPTIIVTGQAADLTGYFEVITTGAWVAATRSFVIQVKRAGSGYEAAAAAGCRIHFAIFFNNSTGI